MRLLLTALFHALFSFTVQAQSLRADFTIDKSGGCSPLSVTFTNISSGTTSNTTYQWDFGNGNTSTLKNAGAVFYDEKSYTVTLSIKEGTQTSSVSRTVTVYKKPVIDFTFTPANGCMPMPVSFNATAAQGDGFIAAWHWDFGDGSTQQGSQSINHTYNFQQTASVNLTAITNFGCAASVSKKDIISVKGPLKAGFNADRTIFCNAPGTVTFTNTSFGPGTLYYLWEFGDGGRSTDRNPVYTYTRKGTYTVKLTLTSSEGCTDVFQVNNYINVDDFKTDFTYPAQICSDGYVTLNNTSSPVPTQSTWVIDGLNTYYSYGNSPITPYFGTSGNPTIQLTNNFGPCTQSITKQIQIKRKPQLNGFISDVVELCNVANNVRVQFRDTTADAVSWQWKFDLYNGNSTWTSTIQAPSQTYFVDGIYWVQLTVTNSEGCTNTVTKPVGIARPLVGIFLDPGSSYEACGSLTTKFNVRTTDPLVSYEWNFGDQTTSTDLNPTHTFTQPGAYSVSLKYKTALGCTGTAYYNSIRVWQKPVANFNVQPTVCGNTPVVFTNLSTGYATGYLWDFGDNQWNSLQPNIHQYQQAGDYNVRLIAWNGLCNDTITKVAVIKVSPPFPKISMVVNTCEGSRGLMKFMDETKEATSWTWDFGDGTTTTYTNAQPFITHTYTNSSTYKVVLSTTNGSCTVKDSTTAYVLLKQNPILKLDKTEACAFTQVPYHITGLGPNPRHSFLPQGDYYFSAWQGNNATPFNGTYTYPWMWETNADGTITSWEVRADLQVRAIITSYYFNCQDTTNYVPLKSKGVAAGFEIVTDNVCFKSPVVLRDTSKTITGDPITSWQWQFGDGNIQTVTQPGLINHTYANPGYYFVNLKVTDAAGCTINTTSSQYIQVAGPKAAFNFSNGNNVQLNTTVTFYNYSNTYNSPNTAWKWDISNGVSFTSYSPSYQFTVPGDYTVRLIAENPATGCKDTSIQTITVRNFNSGFTTNASFIGNYSKCPPVIARFTNTSQNFTRVVWDFGDGFTLENQNFPSHIYTTSGTYIVTLYVYGFNGLTGTYKDTVFVNLPEVSINANDLDGCIGQSISLNAPQHTGVTSYLWDFGNGQINNVTDSFATHQFVTPGSYTPTLLVKDANGCQAAVSLVDKIVIYPDPVVKINPAAPLVCKGAPVQLTATGAATYEWSPAIGLNAANIASPMASPATTTLYTITAKDVNGCEGKNTITVNVAQPFDMNASGTYDVCKGNTVQLRADGADSYKWIDNVTGLSNTGIPNPVSKTDVTTIYTLVGYDQYKCYTDTAQVNVVVRPLPFVNAGPDRETTFGNENVLNVTNSPDVTRWNWTPAEFLSCTNCAAPVSRPYTSMDYIVTVYNNYNCQAKDTVHINAICTGASIYVPNAFSPNGDGKNETFAISGSGVRIIRSFRIYNRWGEIVFERKNFYPNSVGSSWNGKYKGFDADAGVYVYFAEMECDANEVFERKGAVLLVR